MNGKPTVYIETTITSFLTSRPSSNLIVAGEQEITRQWWDRKKEKYDLFVSELVIEEAERGDPQAAKKRIEAIEGIPMLAIDEETIRLTSALIESGVIPQKAAADAAHIAIAARNNIDYLLTWNCKHIANAEIIRRLSFVISEEGYYLPILCTPIELFGEGANE